MLRFVLKSTWIFHWRLW